MCVHVYVGEIRENSGWHVSDAINADEIETGIVTQCWQSAHKPDISSSK